MWCPQGAGEGRDNYVTHGARAPMRTIVVDCVVCIGAGTLCLAIVVT